MSDRYNGFGNNDDADPVAMGFDDRHVMMSRYRACVTGKLVSMEDDADPADAADDDDGAAAAAAADDEDDDGAWVAIAGCYGGFIHVVNCLGAAKGARNGGGLSPVASVASKPGGGKTGDR